MRIALLSPVLGEAFRALGHEVVTFWPTDVAVFDLHAALEAQQFRPDLIFQEEFLGPRFLLAGLEAFDCPKIFWSLDTHLNRHWHRWYAQCFDGVVTPHLHLWQQFPWRLPQAGRLAFPAYARPWVPHNDRKHDVSFVGRITPQRPRRAWLAEFLRKHFHAIITQDISRSEMLELYMDTRLAPNEAIQAEVNFRVTEAAGCGSLVLTQNIGPDQDALFEPGKEVVVYDHALELQVLLERFRRFPDSAEVIAKAGWDRVQASHLPQHRVGELLAFLQTVPASPPAGINRALAWRLARWELVRNKRHPGDLEKTAQSLTAYTGHPEAMAAILETYWLVGKRQEALALAVQIMQHPTFIKHPSLVAACSGLALCVDQFALAKQFTSMITDVRKIETPCALLLHWAALLCRHGLSAYPGRNFEPLTHLPVCGTDCLFFAMHFAPGDVQVTRRLEALLATCGGYEHIRLGLLSDLSLRKREDWRTSLNLSLANLRAFRLQQGIEEAILALQSARAQGKEGQFIRFLQGMDASGYLAQTLAAIA